MNMARTKENVHRWLVYAILIAAKDCLPITSEADSGEFSPLDKIESIECLIKTLDYVADTYGDQIVEGSREGMGCMLLIENIPVGHPVYLLGTLYVLLVAGVDIHVRYAKNSNHLYHRMVDALEVIGWLHGIDADRSDEEVSKYFRKKELSQLIALGDVANCNQFFPMARRLGNITLHYPSAHLLIADYQNAHVFTEKNALFADKCWYEVIDYEAYRAPTNQDEELSLGFDFGDLFWGADAVVNSWNNLECMKDKIPTIIFTDRPREEVWLPEGFERCCSITFFDDYDCKYPLYNFLQLVT